MEGDARPFAAAHMHRSCMSRENMYNTQRRLFPTQCIWTTSRIAGQLWFAWKRKMQKPTLRGPSVFNNFFHLSRKALQKPRI